MMTLAVDIGGTKVSVALISGDGSFLLKKQISTPHERCPDEMTRALRLLVSEIKGTTKRFVIISTEVIDNRILTTLNPDNLGGLREYSPKSVMEDMIGLNGSVINDAQAIVWTEYTVLSKETYDTVFTTAPTGVRGGIAVNRRLSTGVSGLAGRVGHILSGITDTGCGCGRRGCVEAVSSGRVIMGIVKNELAGYSTKYIFGLTRQGYRETEFLAGRSASTTAGLIVSLKLLFNCRIAVVGGGIGFADGYVQKVSKHLSIYSETCNVVLLPACLRSDSGLIGTTLWDRDCVT